MGPVSFESVDAGSDRPTALELASTLAHAGVRVVSLQPHLSNDLIRYRLVVFARDLEKARELVAAHHKLAR